MFINASPFWLAVADIHPENKKSIVVSLGGMEVILRLVNVWNNSK